MCPHLPWPTLSPWRRLHRGLSVLPVSALIVPAADSYALTEDVPLQVAAGAGVLANDAGPPGSSLQAVLVEDVAAGTLTLHGDGSFEYAPPPDWNGTVEFVYRAFDGTSYSQAVTVTLTTAAVSDPPVAVDDGSAAAPVETFAGTAVAVAVLNNDADADGDQLQLPSWTAGQGGTVTLDADTSQLVYTPNAGFAGPDSFSYTVSDATGGSDTATVFVRVLPPDGGIQPAADAYTVAEDGGLTVAATAGVLSNDSGAGTLQAVLVGAPAKGNVSLEPDGSFTYQPFADADGTDTFTYRAFVSAAQGYSPAVTVTLSITPVNDAPVLDPNGSYMNEDGWLEVDLTEGQTVTLTPEELVYDPEGDPVEFVIGSENPGSGVTLSSGTLTVTGDPVGDS
jgi:VCBS repeat-containing protein